MSRHSSPFPSCFRPSPTTTTTHHQEPPPPPPPPPPPSTNLTTTCLYNTHLGLFCLTWSHNHHSNLLRRRHLHLHHHHHHLHIKPFLFFNQQGSKSLHTQTHTLHIFWDLTKCKFSPTRPEPISGFYIAVVVDGQMTLLVGDKSHEAYAKTKPQNPIKLTQTCVMQREHILGHKMYTTQSNFGNKTHNITIDFDVNNSDSRLHFFIDSKRVLKIKHLKWKFRGNERIEVDGYGIQVSWDVYNWLFDHEHGNNDDAHGHALFMFRFEEDHSDHGVQDFDQLGMWDHQQVWGFGMCGFERKKMKKGLLKSGSSITSDVSSASSSSSVMEWASVEESELRPNGFSLLIFAWKS